LFAVDPEELNHSMLTLQLRYVYVEVHAVNAFDLKQDVLLQYFGYTLCYFHDGFARLVLP